MRSVEHIGVAVREVEAALRVYRDLLGLEIYKHEYVESEGLSTHFVDGGTVKVELLQPDDADSATGRFLERRGPGLHHLAFYVQDLHAALERARSLGLAIVGEAPRSGADGKNVAFIHPRDGHGVLIELCEDVVEPVGVPDGPDIPARVVGRGPHVLTVIGDRTEFCTDSVMRLLHAVEPEGRTLMLDQNERDLDATEVRNVVHAFGQVERPVIGVGTGATVALRAAEDHPELFRQILLVEPRGELPAVRLPTVQVDVLRAVSAANTDGGGAPAYLLPPADQFEDARVTRLYGLLIRHLLAREA